MENKIMNKLIYFTFLFLIKTNIFSQEKTNKKDVFLAGLHYVNSFNIDDYLSKNYNGIIGLDVKYKFADFDFVLIDGGVSFDYLNGKRNSYSGITFNNMFIINPNIGIEFDPFKMGLKPFLI